ncbi:unnamed protein product [Enterobius vermicularis]|uniref:HORMA domain-containing protein n=1 Tax=Enterobius vermicularis TaxID=51028 RepID=A0A0N4VCN1_ENTVE|nr:unnamed protein product [Enterobius vermicularis]
MSSSCEALRVQSNGVSEESLRTSIANYFARLRMYLGELPSLPPVKFSVKLLYYPSTPWDYEPKYFGPSHGSYTFGTTYHGGIFGHIVGNYHELSLKFSSVCVSKSFDDTDGEDSEHRKKQAGQPSKNNSISKRTWENDGRKGDDNYESYPYEEGQCGSLSGFKELPRSENGETNLIRVVRVSAEGSSIEDMQSLSKEDSESGRSVAIPDAAAKEADEEGPDIKKKVFFTINYYGGVICESSSKVRKSRARSLDSLSPVGRASKKRKGDSLPPELETQKTDLTEPQLPKRENDFMLTMLGQKPRTFVLDVLSHVQFGELTPSTSATKASYGSSHGLLDITGTNSGRLCFFESHFPSKGQCYLVSNLISSSFWRVDGAFSGGSCSRESTRLLELPEEKTIQKRFGEAMIMEHEGDLFKSQSPIPKSVVEGASRSVGRMFIMDTYFTVGAFPLIKFVVGRVVTSVQEVLLIITLNTKIPHTRKRDFSNFFLEYCTSVAGEKLGHGSKAADSNIRKNCGSFATA